MTEYIFPINNEYRVRMYKEFSSQDWTWISRWQFNLGGGILNMWVDAPGQMIVFGTKKHVVKSTKEAIENYLDD